MFMVSGIGLVLNQAILAFCVESLKLSLLFSKLAATGVVFFWNYFARRVLVFGAVPRLGMGRDPGVEPGAIDLQQHDLHPAGHGIR